MMCDDCEEREATVKIESGSPKGLVALMFCEECQPDHLPEQRTVML